MGLSRYFHGSPALRSLALPLLVAHLAGNAFKRSVLEFVLNGDGGEQSLTALMAPQAQRPATKTTPLEPAAIWDLYILLRGHAKALAGNRKIVQSMIPFPNTFISAVDRAGKIGLLDMDADMGGPPGTPSQPDNLIGPAWPAVVQKTSGL